MIIRQETPSDIQAVRIVLMEAFGRPHEGLLVDDIRQAGKAAVALVAAVKGETAGYVLFTDVLIEPARMAWKGAGLAPVGVSPDAQGKGMGTALVREGLEACRKAGYRAVVVLGDPKFYGRFGFSRASGFGIANVYGAEEEFLALELVPGSLTGVKGTVKYQQEFNGLV